jgi:hypothetical protein
VLHFVFGVISFSDDGVALGREVCRVGSRHRGSAGNLVSVAAKGTGTVCAKHPSSRCAAKGPSPLCQESLPHPTIFADHAFGTVPAKIGTVPRVRLRRMVAARTRPGRSVETDFENFEF